MNQKTLLHTNRSVRIWLLIGLTMIFFQVVLGGLTRLTGSGLSITKWDIITGTVPPLNQVEWNVAYELYQATPQYKIVNTDMTLSSFKRIYFWEYIHRLWARTMGFVFVFPLLYFLRKRWIAPWLKKDLWVVFLLAALVASFGWIMVASGLMSRPWVNAYKLMLHLSLAILLFAYLLITYLKSIGLSAKISPPFGKSRKLILLLLIVTAGQMMLGGLMAGMKAGVAYPSWPKMNGVWIPDILLEKSAWTWANMKAYDSNVIFAKTIVQFAHRMAGYTIFILIVILFYKIYNTLHDSILRKNVAIIGVLVVSQIVLGILTVMACRYGKVPLTYGVLHQAIGLITFSGVVILYHLYPKDIKKV